jgi:hypothetical protein
MNMYILKTSDRQHKQLGTSTGDIQNDVNGSFWITGWSQQTQEDVYVGESYYLSNANGENFSSVEVKEIVGAEISGIRFKRNNLGL